MIHDAKSPTSIQSFFRMATYCAKFIQNFSDIAKPLRELTRKDMKFTWISEHNQALNMVKQLLTSSTVMAYFDQQKETELTTDASPVGLSEEICLHTLQLLDHFVLEFSETILPQTEKKGLAIMWDIEKLHLYLHLYLYEGSLLSTMTANQSS